MRFSTGSTNIVTLSLLLQSFASACNPLTDGSCSPNKALGRTVNVDFTQGPSSEFTAQYNTITYESDGIHLGVTKEGDAPLLASNWYIMFGRFEIVFKSAPGVGMVSSAILQSDDLDEIDWELLGANPDQAQTNYFGRGVTETYDREVTVADATATTAFNTYVIDWNQDRIIWSINGAPLRTLYAANADVDSTGKSEYPQTPMQIKIGPWAGGAPGNAPGTISWAGGAINYGGGPYEMIVQSLSVTDYSTGSEYQYNNGFSGSYQGITAVGGTVLGNAGGNVGAPAPSVGSPAPSSIAVSTPARSAPASSSAVVAPASSSAAASSPVAYPPTTVTTSSIVDTHTGWPWVSTSTASAGAPAYSSTTTTMSYSSGSSSSASVSSPSASASASAASPSSSSAAETTTIIVAPQQSSLTSASASGTSSALAPGSGPGSISAPGSALASPTASGSASGGSGSASGSVTMNPTTTTFVAQSQAASSTSSSSVAPYTGAASRSNVAKIGAAACLVAGLALVV